jgi:hypothetical protein
MPRVQPVNVIHGYIEHRYYPWHLSREAFLWLALLCDRRLFRASLGQTKCYRARTPLVLLGNLLFARREGLQEEIPF